jgi:hypothetical protein
MEVLYITALLERGFVPGSGDRNQNSDLNSDLNVGTEWAEDMILDVPSLAYGVTVFRSETLAETLVAPVPAKA